MHNVFEIKRTGFYARFMKNERGKVVSKYVLTFSRTKVHFQEQKYEYFPMNCKYFYIIFLYRFVLLYISMSRYNLFSNTVNAGIVKLRIHQF